MSTIKTKNIQHPSATEPALVMNPDGTFNATMDDVVAQSLNGGTFSFRNKLINGTFDIWQRGSNFSVAGYTADRWYGDQTTAKTRVFGPQGQTYGMSLSGATTLVQSIELPLVGKAGEFYNGSTWVLSWYSTTDTFTPNVEFRDATVDAGGVAVTTGTPVAVETVGIWTRYKAEVTIDQDPLGTNECLSVLLAASGATSIAGVQFEKGGLTELEHRPIGTELELCQRYFQKWQLGSRDTRFFTERDAAAINFVGTCELVVPMRAFPHTVTFGNDAQWNVYAGAAYAVDSRQFYNTAASAGMVNVNRVGISITSAALASALGGAWQIVPIRCNSNTEVPYALFDAEF
jgi:hypothetical protein